MRDGGAGIGITAPGERWRNVASSRVYTVLQVADEHVRVRHVPHGNGYWMTVTGLQRNYRKETP